MATVNRPIIIAVIGSRQPTKQEAIIAERVGGLLARKGAILICGGLTGIMEAACKGAQSAGGLTIGVLPSDDAHTANPYVVIPIVTNIGYARNVIVVRSARAVIAIGGGYGTLTEIGYALDAKIPVIGINTWSLSKQGKPDTAMINVQTAGQAVNKALKLAGVA